MNLDRVNLSLLPLGYIDASIKVNNPEVDESTLTIPTCASCISCKASKCDKLARKN